MMRNQFLALLCVPLLLTGCLEDTFVTADRLDVERVEPKIEDDGLSVETPDPVTTPEPEGTEIPESTPTPTPAPDPEALPPEDTPPPGDTTGDPEPIEGVQCSGDQPDLALLLTSPALGTGLKVSSNSALLASGGVVHVNRSGLASIRLESNSRIQAAEIRSVGLVSRKSNSALLGLSLLSPVRPDPLASLAAPSSEGLVVRSGDPMFYGNDEVITLQPGIYRGLHLEGSSRITLAPGIYFFESGDLSVHSNSQLSGANVRIVFMAGSIHLDSNARLDLSGLEDGGPWSGTALWSRASGSLVIDSNTQWSVYGRVYLPQTYLELRSNSDMVVGSQVILNRLLVLSNSQLEITSDGFLPPCP